MDKKTLRQMMLKKRDEPFPRRMEMEAAIRDAILEMAAPWVGIYVSMKGEVDTHKTIKRLLEKGIRVCCPRVKGSVMHFYEIKAFTDLELGTFGILEPKQGCSLVEPNQIHQIFVPMVAYNANLYRLGHGAGYYDRYLSKYHNDIIGIAFTRQNLNVSFEEAHDIPCAKIITEQGIISNHTI